MGSSPFSVSPRPSLDNALVALDTNTLLLPYTASHTSLEEVEKVYARLAKQKRLVVPVQVAAEYERNRPLKLGELWKALHDLMSKSLPAPSKYPLLEGLAPWKAALADFERVASAFKDAQGHLREVCDLVQGWDRADPVLEAYARSFGQVEPIGHGKGADEMKKETARRFAEKIPPGYKDANKDDGGGGDVEIWFTLLAAAKDARRDLVFVTYDEKGDWFHRQGNKGLYPRAELLREFREATAQEFHLIRLSELLKAMDAPQAVVEDVKAQEHMVAVLDISRGRGPEAEHYWLQPSFLPSASWWDQFRYPASESAAAVRVELDALGTRESRYWPEADNATLYDLVVNLGGLDPRLSLDLYGASWVLERGDGALLLEPHPTKGLVRKLRDFGVPPEGPVRVRFRGADGGVLPMPMLPRRS